MYEQHEYLQTPPDGTTIWRYLPLAQFVSFLSTRSLWFSRPDLFDDPWEGALTKKDVQELRQRIELERGVASISFNMLRSGFAVNCWHMSSVESMALWKVHGGDGDRVAIQTTVRGLKRAVSDVPFPIWITRIDYVDYEHQSIRRNNPLVPLAFKRKQFEFERELRAIVNLDTVGPDHVASTTPADYPGFSTNRPVGVNIVVDVSRAIESVWVPPLSPLWYTKAVKSLLSKYGFEGIPVRGSALDETPPP